MGLAVVMNVFGLAWLFNNLKTAIYGSNVASNFWHATSVFFYNSNLGCSSTLDRALMMLL